MNPPRAARRAVLATAALCTLLAPPVLVSGASTNNLGGLVVIGDSITVGADAFGGYAEKIRRAGLWTDVRLDARFGRTAAQGAAILAATMKKKAPPTAVVIALGTNDMMSRRETWYPAAVIDLVMSRSRGVPVLWVTPAFSRDIHPDWHVRASRFNRALRAARNEWPNLVVGEWARTFIPAGRSRYVADGVHLTVSGYRTRSRWMTDETKSFGRVIAAATSTTAPSVTGASTTVEPGTTTSVAAQ